MLTSTDFSGLINGRFVSNFFPVPATSPLVLGQKPPDFLLPDITHKTTVRLSDYRGKQPVILAFTRIFTEKQYCPLCYPHLVELNEKYEQFTEQGIEILTIVSTDNRQSRHVVQDLGLKMPVLSNPSCDVFRSYRVGQALGAPLPAQFVLDIEGKLRYKHLFSFLSANAPIEKLFNTIATVA
jgi:peroxiredoxin